MKRTNLANEIHYQGILEEYHQKKGNYFMYDYHKTRRLQLLKDINKIYLGGE